MKERYLLIDDKAYIGIGDGDWLTTFQELLASGWKKGWSTKDAKGRYWLVLERNA